MSGEPAEKVPDVLVPAVTAAVDAIAGVSVEVLTDSSPTTADLRVKAALTILRAAIDQRAIVPRSEYDNLESRVRQALGLADRFKLQLEDVGRRRQEAERLCHQLAEALETGAGVSTALELYHAAGW